MTVCQAGWERNKGSRQEWDRQEWEARSIVTFSKVD